MGKMKQQLSNKVFKGLVRQPKRQLHDILVVTNIAKNAVEDARRTLSNDPRARLRFPVPTIHNDRIVVARDRTEMLLLLEQTASRDLYAQALVSAVAVTEGYLVDMLSLILRAFPKKLGGKDKTVDLNIVVQAKCLEDVLEEVISKKILSVFYTKPAEYFKNFEEILSISIPDDRKAAYCEIKATRDIYVHNGGIVNYIYLEKAGDLSRAKEGELISIDQRYFSESIALMRATIILISNRLRNKYKESEELETYLAARRNQYLNYL